MINNMEKAKMCNFRGVVSPHGVSSQWKGLGTNTPGSVFPDTQNLLVPLPWCVCVCVPGVCPSRPHVYRRPAAPFPLFPVRSPSCRRPHQGPSACPAAPCPWLIPHFFYPLLPGSFLWFLSLHLASLGSQQPSSGECYPPPTLTDKTLMRLRPSGGWPRLSVCVWDSLSGNCSRTVLLENWHPCPSSPQPVQAPISIPQLPNPSDRIILKLCLSILKKKCPGLVVQ